MPEGMIKKVKDKDLESIFECFIYSLLLIGCTADVFITTNVILINDIAAFNAGEAAKIAISLAGIKVVSELDNWFASFYISSYV